MTIKLPRKRWFHSVLVTGLIWGIGAFYLPHSARADAATPFIGEITCGGWNFCPSGWAECDGTLLNIADYDALFALIGTTYGGDGVNTFAVPNILGRTMVHQGQGPGLTTKIVGETGGAETVTLTSGQLPVHTHAVAVHTGTEKSASPTNSIPGHGASSVYTSSAPDTTLAATTVGNTGGSQPHNNLQPYLVSKCCISVYGIWPSQ